MGKKVSEITKENWRKWRGKPVCVLWEDTAFTDDPGESESRPMLALDFGLLDLYDPDHPKKPQVRIIGEFFSDGGKRRDTSIPFAVVKRVIPWVGWKVPDEFVRECLEEQVGSGATPAIRHYYR